MSSRDERLAEILDSLTAELRSGKHPDVTRATRDNPDLADELVELWGTIVVTEEVVQPEPDSSPTRTSQLHNQPLDSTPAVAPGERLEGFNDYEIIRELGRGGMGVVYEARQSSLDRRVALKILLGGEHARDLDVARFQAEAEATARLDHPNIVPVFDVGSTGEVPFFTMRFVEGETLAQRLERGPLSDRDAVELILPVVHAIQHAHEHGILHRDLKPSNILLDREGTPHVTDFGLAKRTDSEHSLTQSGAIVGTPAYMSPEQASGGDDVGPASDVYSIGAVLYHMLTGRPIFRSRNAVDVILSVLQKDPPPPRLLESDIDRDLEMIVMKCLQKPRELRYASAAALTQDLEAYLDGEQISVRSISLPLLFSRLFRETHHAPVLENWGLLWMWHSAALIVLCLTTNTFQWLGVATPLACIALWLPGLGTWAAIFWSLRKRAGPITFIERQIAHIWAGSVIGSSSLFFIEMVLELPALTLSPVLGILAGMVFTAKAGILSGEFYAQALALFLTAPLMVAFPDVGLTIFGLVSAASFFVPGLKYYRRRRRG